MVYRTDLSGHVRIVSDGDMAEVLEGGLDELKDLHIPDQLGPPAVDAVVDADPEDGVVEGGDESVLTPRQLRKKQRKARRAQRRERGGLDADGAPPGDVRGGPGAVRGNPALVRAKDANSGGPGGPPGPLDLAIV